MSATCHAAVLHQPGGPDALEWEQVEVPDPGPGEVTLRHTAVGLNFVDISQRRGSYPAMPKLPAVLGMEAAGVVEAVGGGVTDYAVGDRVSYCMVVGGYAEARTMSTDRLNKLPDAIPDEVAAACTLRGLTAHYLLHDSYAVRPGDTILVHAAAGGMGLMLCQWAKHLGCTVLGTVSSDDKAEVARAHGCDHPIVYTRDDFAAAVMDLTGGKGVNANYDAVGKDTFEKGIGCLAERGHIISYGQASGPLEPLDLAVLTPKSLTITRGGLVMYTKDPVERAGRAKALWGLIADGTLKVEINQRYPLEEVGRAHADVEARKTTGSTVLEV